jgi:hypothetical protein
MTRLCIIALAVTTFGACGKKDDSGGKAGDKADKSGNGNASIGTIDVAAVNAAVPTELKDKIVFEKRDFQIEQGRHPTTYTLAAPKNWTQESKMFAHIKGDDKAGFFTTLQIGADCDGECKPKQWQQIADKNFFQPRKTDGKVVKDTTTANTRSMIVDVDKNGVKTRDVVFVWWSDGAKNYHTCVASLDDSIKEAAVAFEKACSAVTIAGDD